MLNSLKPKQHSPQFSFFLKKTKKKKIQNLIYLSSHGLELGLSVEVAGDGGHAGAGIGMGGVLHLLVVVVSELESGGRRRRRFDGILFCRQTNVIQIV